MAHLKNEAGTEIECPDDMVKQFQVDGWEVSGDEPDHGHGGRRKPSRKAADS